jgi:hypothetical protein
VTRQRGAKPNTSLYHQRGQIETNYPPKLHCRTGRRTSSQSTRPYYLLSVGCRRLCRYQYHHPYVEQLLSIYQTCCASAKERKRVKIRDTISFCDEFDVACVAVLRRRPKAMYTTQTNGLGADLTAGTGTINPAALNSSGKITFWRMRT